MNIRRSFLALVLLLVATNVSSTATTASSDHETRIGVVLSLTGDVGPYGQRSLRGVDLAVADVNAAGGIQGRRVSLIVEDARSQAKDAVSALTKLIELNHLHVVIGDVQSGTTLAMAPIAQKKRVLLFAPGASNPALRGAGDMIFRNWVSDDYDARAMAQYMLHQGVTKTCVLNQQAEYTVGLADAYQREFERSGGHVESRESFPTDSTDFRTHVLKLKHAACNAVYLVGESRQNGAILRQAAEDAVSKKWFANLTVDTPECRAVAGAAREGVIFTTPAFDPNDKAPQVRKFADAYRRRYHTDPDATSGIAYDALMIVALAMQRAGDDPAKIRDEILHIKGYPGVSGSTSFDAHGDVVKDIFVKTIKADHSVLVQRFAFST
jgi:branched-chain amino acid transport system substrate-binding protein